jgi:hypothetical protein
MDEADIPAWNAFGRVLEEAFESKARSSRVELDRLASRVGRHVDVARRARVVLAIAGGSTFCDSAAVFGTTVSEICTWYRAFARRGPAGLRDRTGTGGSAASGGDVDGPSGKDG